MLLNLSQLSAQTNVKHDSQNLGKIRRVHLTFVSSTNPRKLQYYVVAFMTDRILAMLFNKCTLSVHLVTQLQIIVT